MLFMSAVASPIGGLAPHDAEGFFVGPMRLPANVSPVQVSGLSVLSIVRDEMDRGTVALNDVRWTG